MKVANIFIFTLLFLFCSCTSFDTPPNEKEDEKTTKFLLLQTNTENKLAEGAYLSMLYVNNKGQSSISKVADIYPPRTLRENADIFGTRLAIGLHNDFNEEGSTRKTKGAWLDTNENSWKEVPLFPTGSEYRYSYYDASTTKVSESGHVFYHSSSNESWYHDQYIPTIVRYDPKTDKLEAAISPKGFVLAQPEKGWDTETGQTGRQFYPSPDGRYVYGVIDAYGVDGGVIHWDYKILFKYDFQTQQYTRIDEAEDRSVNIMGITSDKKYVAYTSSVSGQIKRKMVNTATNSTTVFTLAGGQAYAHPSRWNSSGYCSGETNNTIGVYNLISDQSHNIKTQTVPYYAQFSPNGDFIYFMIETAKGNYLCRTSNITATATIDTVCALPANLIDFLVVRD
jgi:hypothetical protein